MTQEIQISCTPDDWMASTVQVTDVPGFAPCYTHLPGHELPEPQKSQFQAIIDMFRSMGADQWTASSVSCRRLYAGTFKITQEDGSEQCVIIKESVVISMIVKVGWGEEAICHSLEDADSLALYDTLVSAEFWINHLQQKEKNEARLTSDNNL